MAVNCTAINKEYNTEKKYCQQVFDPCIIYGAACDVQKFCSDECRSIYYNVLSCTSSLSRLKDINLLCGTSSDPLYPNTTCLDHLINSNANGTSYGYSGSCALSIVTRLSYNCTELCRGSLMLYKKDCCTINIALMGEISSLRHNKDVINIHNHDLWEHCQVEGPQMCPTPPCPTSMSPPLVTSTPELAAGAERNHVNWIFCFLISIIIVIVR